MTEQQTCAAIVHDGRRHDPWCGLPIEGYGPCVCGLDRDEHERLGELDSYQPTQWRHISPSGPDWVGAWTAPGHPAVPAAEEAV